MSTYEERIREARRGLSPSFARYSKTAIGVFWVLSVLLEIAFFATQGRWFRRFGLFRSSSRASWWRRCASC